MKKVIVIGSGIAGLSAACFLADKGFYVEVIEASPKPGGRAYSFTDKESGLVFDNGQHIMMGCYKETLRFLSLIGASDKVSIQKNLNISFLGSNGESYHLQSSSAPYPINLIAGILKYKALSLGERLSVLRVFSKFLLYSDKDLKKRSVHEWLTEEKQSSNAVSSLWEIICIGTLNCTVYRASAYLFVHILKEIFLKGNKNSAIVLPRTGLSEMYCKDAVEFIESRGGMISFNEKVEKLKIKNSKVVTIKTNSRELEDFDLVVSTIPYYALKKIVPVKEIDFEYSSILSVHLVLKDNPLKEDFYGLLGSPVQWIFNKGTHISVVISSADEFINRSREEISELVINEVIKYTPISRQNISDCRVIKEKRATFIPSNQILNKRPGVESALQNLFIAGDWVQTNLPATLEGGIISSCLAVDKISQL